MGLMRLQRGQRLGGTEQDFLTELPARKKVVVGGQVAESAICHLRCATYSHHVCCLIKDLGRVDKGDLR